MLLITLCLFWQGVMRSYAFQNGFNDNVFLRVITHLYGIFCLLKGGITSFFFIQ